MQVLAGGASLIDWGDLPAVTQYASDGAVDMDLSLSAWSYRAYRFPWIGSPLTPPAVAARIDRAGTTVWASWNGSTEVRAWRALAGSRSSQLNPVGPARSKKGFETAIFLHRRYAKVAVQALGATGTSYPPPEQ